MATRPARKPFTVIPQSQILLRGYTYASALRPPAHAARVVFAATRPQPAASIAERVLPGLNPYHPNQRMTPPTAAIVMSWPGIMLPPSRLNLRPRRGPRAMAPARAMKPPIVWTTVEPAKSRKGFGVRVVSQPSGPQAQCPMIG